MNWSKVLIAGLIGGITYFILGFLVWDVLLGDYIVAPACVARSEEDFVFWAMVLSCLVWAFMLAYVFEKWASISTWKTGASAGLTLGLLIAATVQFANHAMMSSTTLTVVALDVLATGAVSGIVGAVVGWWLGRGK